MPCIPPFEDKIEGKSLHLLWNQRIYAFLRDFFSTVCMAPPQEYDEYGNPQIYKRPGTGAGWEIPYAENTGSEGYSGMFAIQDETEYSSTGASMAFRVRVTGGTANVNGEAYGILDLVEDFSGTDGRTYYLLAATEDDGYGVEAFVGRALGAGSYTNTPDGYTVKTRLLLGHVGVDGGRLTIRQDYLAGSANQLIVAEWCPP